MILAKLNQPEFEYDIHSLIKAFFPEENVSATAEDKKYEEISELVGTSIGALKASYHIAVEKITNFIKTKE